MTELEAAPAQFGAWKLIGSADSTGKRLVARCTHCGSVKTISAEALAGGGHVNCTNCAPPTHMGPTAKSFASGVAASEGRSARKRQFGQGEDG
jgi:hypothetical protein